MKAKSIFITTLLSLFVVSGVFAQDKYEYGVVELVIRKITFTTADKVEVVAGNAKEPTQEFFQKINQLSLEGWEIVSANGANGVVYYHLRKKKN